MPIFGLSKNSAVAALRLTESHVDYKQELEKALKAACEALIMSVTKLVVEPMLSFLHKVTATRAAAAVRLLLTAPCVDAPAATR